MRVLFVHNDYNRLSGEENAASELATLLETNGHQVKWFRRTSSVIGTSFWGKVKAFFCGIYNPSSARGVAKVLDDFKPDVVQVQNLYPFLSSSIFSPINKRGIPVVMRCPNYRLFCPNGLCLTPRGEVCEKCFGGKEWYCILNNCENSFFKSMGYALRNMFSRVTKNILNGVDVFIVQSEFQKRVFVSQGILSERIVILPGICPTIQSLKVDNVGKYVSFVGRVSHEKGIYEFIEAAKMNPDFPFRVAGAFDDSFAIPKDCPTNVEFCGFLKGDDLNKFYLESRVIVIPSKWYEGFPNVITRGMLLKRPVITTNIGAMPSIIDHGINGLLVAPGNSEQLGYAVGILYNDIDLCRQMGNAGFEKASKNYSRETIYQLLIDTYEKLIG